MSEDYRVQLDVFSGPLDLLLYLIRRDELDIQDIPIARVTKQYLTYVTLLEALDPNAAGDFLVMASTLVELKSRSLLPTPPLEAEEDEDNDPRAVLVRQLLEYKRFKDAARALGSSADEHARKFVRKPGPLPADLEGVELEEAEVWDLLNAFGRVMASIGAGPKLHEVTYDETPLEEYQAFIEDTITRDGPTRFDALFSTQVTRAEIVGLFLAVLELIRNRRVRAEQEPAHGTVYLFALEEVEEDEPLNDEEREALEATMPAPDATGAAPADDALREDPTNPDREDSDEQTE